MSSFSYTSFKLFAIQIRNHIAQILKVSLTEANSQIIPLRPPRLQPQLEPGAAGASAAAYRQLSDGDHAAACAGDGVAALSCYLSPPWFYVLKITENWAVLPKNIYVSFMGCNDWR